MVSVEDIFVFMEHIGVDKLVLFDDGSGHFEIAKFTMSKQAFFGNLKELEDKLTEVKQ